MLSLYFRYALLLLFYSYTSCTHSGQQKKSFTAKQYMKKSMWREAQAGFENILRKSPHDFKAIKYLGIIAVQTGDYSKAVKYLRLTIDTSPSDKKAHYFIAEAYRLQQKYSPSIFHYQFVLEKDPKHIKSLQGLSWCFYNVYYYKNSYDLAKKAMSLEPGNINNIVLWGRVLLKLKKANELKKLFSSTNKNNTNLKHRSCIDSLKGEFYLQRKAIKKADYYFSRAIKYQPLLTSALVGKSKILIMQNKLQLAIVYLKRSRRLDPHIKEIYLYLAIAHESFAPDRALKYYNIFYDKVKADPTYKKSIKKIKYKIKKLAMKTTR
jgi:predicted Zn-dependent protease